MKSIKWLVRLITIELFDFLVLPFQFLVTKKCGKLLLFVQVHDYSIYGHFALVTEIVKSMEYLTKQREKKHDLVFWSIGSRRKAVNKQLFRMARRSLLVLPPPLISAILRNNSRWNAVAIPTKYPSVASLLQDEIGVLNDCKTQLYFSNREILRSQRRLEELEIPDLTRVVCLYLRDSKYLEILAERKDKSLHRNANLDSYVEAIDYLCNMGFSVVRMGKHVAREFPYAHSNFVDYACSNYRCDELDMFLPSLSIMGITSGTGMDAGSFIFRRPTLMIDNGAYCEIPFQLNNLWWRPRMVLKSGMVLSLKEILQSGVARMWRDDQFKSEGLELLRADSAQILKSVRSFSEESTLWSMRSDLNSESQMDADVKNLIELHLKKPYRAHLCSSFSQENADWANSP